MRIARVSGRLTLLESAGAIDVETVSDGLFSADPDRLFDRWDEFVRWSEANLGKCDLVETRRQKLWARRYSRRPDLCRGLTTATTQRSQAFQSRRVHQSSRSSAPPYGTSSGHRAAESRRGLGSRTRRGDRSSC